MSTKTMPSTFFFALLIITFSFAPPLAGAASNISSVIAFGDSTLDAGNNNAIPLTLLRADHPPYGCDFPGHRPTGRFSDGKLITDFLISSLGIKDVLPAYLDPSLKDSDLATGVSFASAGSGYDDLTATDQDVFTMGRQLEYFKRYMERLQGVVGEEKAEEIITTALFVVGAGSNDLMMNYYLLPTRKNNYSMPQYQDFLLQNLKSFVQQVYETGGRKFTISGLPPLGCLPFSMTSGFFTPGNNMMRRACVDQQNHDAVSYNAKLQSLLTSMQSLLDGTVIAYINTYDPLMDMIKNPSDYGFTEVGHGCCGTGLMEMGPLCSGMTPVCANPSDHLFWDAVHPSQKAYETLANELEKSTLPQIR